MLQIYLRSISPQRLAKIPPRFFIEHLLQGLNGVDAPESHCHAVIYKMHAFNEEDLKAEKLWLI